MLFFCSAGACATDAGRNIAFVPLDNRPACLDYTQRIARIAGLELRVPPYSAIGAYVFPGDPAGLRRWLDSIDSPDYLIVSLDMLVYGGLVSSRLDRISETEALENLEYLGGFAARNPRTKIFAFGTIQRIARTSTGVPEQDAVTGIMAEFFKTADEAKVTGNRALEVAAKAMRKRIPGDAFESYLAARRRNHKINTKSVALLENGAIDYLVLGMDDNAEYGPHRRERDALTRMASEPGMEGRILIKPGADEVAHLLLARAINDLNGLNPVFDVRYYPDGAGDWVPPLEDRPLSESVPQSLEAAGIKAARGGGDAVLMVYGKSVGGESAADMLAEDAAGLVSRGVAVGVADVLYVNRSDPALVERLVEKTEIARLAAYSGWNTSGNALGTCIGQMAAFNAFRNNRAAGREKTRAALAAQVEFLSQRFFDEYFYMAVLRPGIESGLAAAGQAPNRISGEHYNAFKSSMASLLKSEFEDFYDRHFRNIDFTGPGGNRFRAGALNTAILVPWFRTFEVEIDVDVEMDDH